MQLIRLNRENRNMMNYMLLRQTNIADISATLTLLRLNNISTSMLIYNDEISQTLYGLRRVDYEALVGTFLQGIDDYIKNTESDARMVGEEESIRLTSITQVREIFVGYFYYVFLTISQGLSENDRGIVVEGLTSGFKHGSDMTVILNDLRDKELVFAEQEYVNIEHYSTRVVFITYLINAMISVTTIGASIFLSRGIQRPLKKLGYAASRIAQGDLEYSIRMQHKDEIGILSNDIGDMVDSLKQATQVKSDFLAYMSHEMRTPLNVIVGSEQLFLENGFQAFLSKPIQVRKLDAIIRRWVQGLT